MYITILHLQYITKGVTNLSDKNLGLSPVFITDEISVKALTDEVWAIGFALLGPGKESSASISPPLSIRINSAII